MSLYGLLQQRQSANKPIRIGMIGAGTFSPAFLNQARITAGLRVVCVADLDVEKARRACLGVGFQPEEIGVGNSPSSITTGSKEAN
jgi:predicted homoserine dehydrogenase-like protein